jgi:hypothetical protein
VVSPPKITKDEEWKFVPGYEGRYMVSSHGRLYSVPRRIKKTHPTHGTSFSVWWKGGLRALRSDSYGYPCAYFGRLQGPMHNGIQIHTVVALTFIGPNPGRLDVRHKDGDIRNNRFDNLEYGTRTQNILDARRSGRPWKKLTIEQAREIRELRAWGFPLKVVAEAYGVSLSAIQKITSYTNLKEDTDYA